MWDMRSRNGGLLWATALAAVLVLQVGCTSGGRPAAKTAASPRPEGAVSSTQVRMPAEIQSIELVAGRGTESVELTADRPLVWTSFRDTEGDLVIELPNSTPAASVRSLDPSAGLIAAVDVELVDDATRPLTRLVVKTREPSEHSLAGEGDLLRIQLTPVGGKMAQAPPAAKPAGGRPAQEAPPPVTLAFEPLPEEDAAPQAEAPVAFGTAEAPLIGPPPTGFAASQLFSVDVVSGGEPTVVRIRGDGEFAYSTFRLESPERFVVDLAGVVNAAGSSTVPVPSDQVDQIRIGQFKPRPDPVSRVVFDLHRPAVPHLERSADGLTVTFTAPGQPAPAAAYEPVGDETVTAEALSFEPAAGESSAAMEEPVAMEPEEPMAMEPEEPVAFEAEPAATEPSMAAAEPIEMEEPEEPPVAAYQPPPTAPVAPARPVRDSMREPSVSRPVGTSDVALFEAQQVQIDVDPRLEEKEKFLNSFGTLVISKEEKEYYGEPIDMSLRKADLVETLRSFATISDLNFVIQPGVSGNVTVELKGVPWDQAMEQILKINNLGMDIDGTIVRIAPTSQLRAEAEEQRRLRAIQTQSVPLRTVLKSLSYSSADEVAGLLRNRTGSILSSRGTVQVDKRTNTLIIRELPGTIDTVLAVIDNLDSPEPQVTIEARIIEATKSFGRSLGIQWGFDALGDNAHGNTTGLQFPNNYTVDGGIGLLTGGANGFLNLTMGNILNTFNLNAQLIAAESEGLVNTVSAPRVTTLNNTPASIQSGVQIPIQTVSDRTVSVQYVNATLQLSVTPQVTAEGTVLLTISVAKRSPQPGLAIVGATNSPISTRQATTKVIVRDGGTAVIGGIYEVSANNTQDRLPGLANIPILGHLFKNRNRTDSNDELMIFITPRIVQM
jgi:type IV pilus assembly protein PilQ